MKNKMKNKEERKKCKASIAKILKKYEKDETEIKFCVKKVEGEKKLKEAKATLKRCIKRRKKRNEEKENSKKEEL